MYHAPIAARRRAIIHIGLPRVGSSSLQRVLHDGAGLLLDNGILYPDLTPASAARPHLNHQHLGEALNGRRSIAERVELLSSIERQLRLRHHDMVILSYEGFASLRWWHGGMAALSKILARNGYAIEVLAAVKPQAEALNSYYTWRVQFLRERRPFGDFAQRAIHDPRLDFGRQILRCARKTRQSITVVPLHDGSDRPFVARFLTEMGLGSFLDRLLPNGHHVRENASPGPVAVEACRRISASLKGSLPNQQARAISHFVETQARIRGHDQIRFNGVAAQIRARCEQRWSISNAQLASHVWARPWESCVAYGASTPINEIATTLAHDELDAARDLAETATAAFGIGARRKFGVMRSVART